MPLADQALAFDGECIAEEGLRKALAPDLRLEQARDLEGAMRRLERAVGLHGVEPRFRRQQLLERALEQRAEALVIRFGDRQSCRLRVAAEALDQARRALGDEIEAVAQVQPGQRASGPLEQAAGGGAREADNRAVQAVLQARGEDADHALVPARNEEGRTVLFGKLFCFIERLLEHDSLDLPALPFEAIELLRAVRGARLVVGDQALDAEAHVGEPAGGVEARPGDEAEVEARGFAWRAARGAQQLDDPRLAVS